MSIVRAWEKYTQACGFLLEFIWEIRVHLPLSLRIDIDEESSVHVCDRMSLGVCVCVHESALKFRTVLGLVRSAGIRFHS